MYFICRLLLIGFLFLCGLCLYVACAIFHSFVPVLIIVLIGLYRVRGRLRGAFTAYGTARWASADELGHQGMTTGSGILLGRLRRSSPPSLVNALFGLFNPFAASARACNRFLAVLYPKKSVNPPLIRLSKACHTAIFSMTGGGKGVSIVVPFLRALMLGCSCVCTDFKGELASLCANRQRKKGFRVVLLDPFKLATRSPDCFNPIDFIDKQSPFALDECRALAEALAVRAPDEKEPHWRQSAESVIAATIASVVVFADSDDRSLQTVRDVLSSPTSIAQMIEAMCGSTEWDGMLARMGEQLKHYKERELGSVLTTANRFLNFLDSPAVADSTRASSFNPGELRDGKTVVYLILPPQYARSHSSLLRMWCASFVGAVIRGGLQEANPVHFMLDEAASLNHLESLDDALDKGRGYGIRLHFIYQSIGQLKRCFPEGQHETFLSNVSQVFFNVNDLATAEYVSNRLGEKTIVVDSGGSNRGNSVQQGGGSHGSYGTSTNANWQQIARKLLKPDEVMALSPRTAITFTPGVPPVCTELTRYYEGNPDSLWRRLLQRLQALRYTAQLLVIPCLALYLMLARIHYQRPAVERPPYRVKGSTLQQPLVSGPGSNR